MSAIAFQVQSFAILSLLIFGVLQARKRPNWHAKLMVSAILWDVILILQIQLARGAVQKAAQMMTNRLILNIHVMIAVTTVILYIVQVKSGPKLLGGDRSVLKWHRKVGVITLVMRLLTFITSFWAVV